jgi:hypothetical protein
MMKYTHVMLLAALVPALIAVTGCKKHIKTPDEFAKMDDPGYDYEYRAISPEEIVIGVQKRPNEPRGDVEFWTTVWKEKYPPIKDYTFVDKESLTTSGGLKGSLLEFTSEEEDGLYRMLVGLFVIKKDIWILTAGGKDEALTDQRDTVVGAFKTFKP